jgi:hypothetical protein
MEIEPELVESENLVGRLKLIQFLEKQSPYREMPEGVETRISQSLEMLPSEFKQAGLAIFGSTYYVPKQMLHDAWNYLWRTFGRMGGHFPRIEECLVLELDRDLLRDEFYSANSLVGRLQDNSPFKSASDILETLMAIEADTISPELKTTLKVLERPYWILLSDLSLSGTSVASEIQKLEQTHRLLFPSKVPNITALIQIITEPAKLEIKKRNGTYIAALNIPVSCALNSSKYSLISNSLLVAKMRELCQWFGQKHVLSTDYRLSKLSVLENNPDIASYGFGAMGWNIVTHKNTPNNSLPILWFRPPSNQYRPPFERIDSRIGPTWSGRRDWLEKIESDSARRTELLEKIAKLGIEN